LHEGGTDRHPSFLVKIEPDDKSCYHCFSCNSRGTLVGLLYELIRYGKDIDDELLERVRRIERQDPVQKAERRRGGIFSKDFRIGVKKHEEEVWNEAEYEPFAGKTHKYILDRGVSVDTCRIWEIGYDPEKRRVMFPVRRFQDNALVGCVGRTIDKDVEPSYLTYFNFKKSDFLYGEHFMKDEREPILGEVMGYDLPAQDGIIIVEGMMDVLKLYGMGYENVVGLMTSNVSKRQIQKLKRISRDIYMMMDWDKAGMMGRESSVREFLLKHIVYDVPGVEVCDHCGSRWSRVGKSAETGRLSHMCRECQKPWDPEKKRKKKDPDSLSEAEILDCLQNAKRVRVSS
jgi:DNA primase